MKAPRPTHIGLIGASGFGLLHEQALTRLQQTGDVILSAICDPYIFTEKDRVYDLQTRGIRLYEDLSTMLSTESDLGAISIATPIPLHYEMAKTCLNNGLFVYLEKPPVPTIWQLNDLLQLDTKNKITVGFQMIESDWSQQIKQWIVDKQLGEIKEITVSACWPRTDNYYRRAQWAGRMSLEGKPVFDGPATNALAHLIHQSMFFSSNRKEHFDTPVSVQAELYRARPIEGYDTCCIKATLGSGCQLFAKLTHASTQTVPFQIQLTGSKGWARICAESSQIESSLGTFPCTLDTPQTLARSYTAFLQAIRGELNKPSSSLNDCKGYLLTTNAALASSRGIHTIDPEFIQTSNDDTAGIYEVKNLAETIADRKPTLFSEAGLPWAISTPTILANQIKRSTSLEMLCQPHAPQVLPE
ncbi:MAG: Gfo/Idh/MocA family protein [Puniceicoccales bacterium]